MSVPLPAHDSRQTRHSCRSEAHGDSTCVTRPWKGRSSTVMPTLLVFPQPPPWAAFCSRSASRPDTSGPPDSRGLLSPHESGAFPKWEFRGDLFVARYSLSPTECGIVQMVVETGAGPAGRGFFFVADPPGGGGAPVERKTLTTQKHTA